MLLGAANGLLFINDLSFSKVMLVIFRIISRGSIYRRNVCDNNVHNVQFPYYI